MYKNEFQLWLHEEKGLYRKKGSLLWYRNNDEIVKGRELSKLLHEWKKITGKEHPDKL